MIIADQAQLKKILRRMLKRNLGFRMCQKCYRQTLVHRMGTGLYCSSCIIELCAKAGLDLKNCSPLDLLPFVSGIDVWARLTEHGDVWEPAKIAYRDDRRGGFGVTYLAGGRGFHSPNDLMVREPGIVVFSDHKHYAMAG